MPGRLLTSFSATPLAEFVVASKIFLIRTPLREVDGMSYSGLMRIKVGPKRLAYAGFLTVPLARFACEHWNVHVEHYIEAWDEAMHFELAACRT